MATSTVQNLMTRQLTLVAISAVQNLNTNNRLAGTMDSNRKNEAQYLTLEEISNTALASSPSGPTPSPPGSLVIHAYSPHTTPTYVIAEQPGRRFLDPMPHRGAPGEDDLKQYCRQFHTISHTLVERGQLENIRGQCGSSNYYLGRPGIR